MLIAPDNMRISRILRNTWQVDLIMLVTCICTYLIRDMVLKYHIEIPTLIPTVLGTAIAFFIGFNNNQAYDRWWEARKIWGALVNDSRSWARGVTCYVTTPGNSVIEARMVHQRMVRRHLAFLYALKGALRNTEDTVYKTYLSQAEVQEVERHSNIHNAILQLQSRDLQWATANNYVDSFRFIQLDAVLVKFSDSMGMAERIKNTVFPTTYNYLTKVFIWLFVIVIELVTSQTMGMWSVFISWLIGFVFVSTQINGMSLVNPFDNKSSSIPLNQITRTIEINLLQMLQEENVPDPVKPINNEYVL